MVVLLRQHGMVLLEHGGMVLVEHGMVPVEHGMVLLEQCVVGLLEHHGAAVSGRDNSSCSAASQAMHSKPFLALLTLLRNPSLLEAIQGNLVKLHVPH